MTSTFRANDCLVNVDMGDKGEPPAWMVHVKEDYFQNPIHLDRVCCRFPELKLCMIHGADPWWDVAIRLMIKYENLHLMTSAWAPKYLPASLLHYMSTRGKSKIIFASDSPVLPIERCLTEASRLNLDSDVLHNYLFANAERFFFSA